MLAEQRREYRITSVDHTKEAGVSDRRGSLLAVAAVRGYDDSTRICGLRRRNPDDLGVEMIVKVDLTMVPEMS